MVESRESGGLEPQPGKERVISGQVRLQRDQNFYDQPPFDEILSTAANELDLPITLMRTYLTQFCKARKKRAEQYGRGSVPQQVVHSEQLGRVAKGRDGNKVIIPGPEMRTLMSSLSEDFPDWEGYIADKHDMGLYRVNGDFQTRMSERSIEASLPPTYMAWLEERFARGRRLRSGEVVQVLGDAFPQQTGTSPSEAREKVMRQWRITRTKGIGK